MKKKYQLKVYLYLLLLVIEKYMARVPRYWLIWTDLLVSVPSIFTLSLKVTNGVFLSQPCQLPPTKICYETQKKRISPIQSEILRPPDDKTQDLGVGVFLVGSDKV